MNGVIIFFSIPKLKFYGQGQGDDSNIGTDDGQQRVIIQRVPNYNNVTINGTLTANAWNGYVGGVIAFRVAGTLSGSGTIAADALGYRGGAGGKLYTTGTQGESGAGVGTPNAAANLGAGGGGPQFKTGGGGGYGSAGTDGTGGAGGGAYNDPSLDRLYFGSGGGGGGGSSSGGSTASHGGQGGGSLFIAASQINWAGTISSSSASGTTGDSGTYGAGSGAGGSIRIEGQTLSITGSVQAASGPSVNGGPLGGIGRIAVYYQNSFSGAFTPNYLVHTGLGLVDSIFSNGFETGDLSAWSSSAADGGNLSGAYAAAYWGYYGLQALVNDNAGLYVQDDTPDAEPHYRARFYLNPNNLSMASGDVLDLFYGYSGTATPAIVFRAQMQQSGSVFQVRISARNGSGTWLDSGWSPLTAGWNALEIDYIPGHLTGQMILSVNGTVVQGSGSLDNDGLKIDSVRLGAMGVDTGTRGTLYFDDFDSRRDSDIGLLADPGVHLAPPGPVRDLGNKVYTYTSNQPHAVTNVAYDTGAPDTFSYDANGNMTCRVEDGQTYNQVYNAENRLATVQQLSQGTCPAADTLATANIAASWNFIYDGDGNRVSQEYFEGVLGQDVTVKITSYFAGGSYELDQSGVVQADATILVSATTTRKYYALAGQTIAMDDGNGLEYFLTDQLGSVVAVLDSTGAILSEQRYLPFGQVRADTGAVTQTDLGFTGQRNLDVQGNSFPLGLMDYHARFYDASLGRFTQPDNFTMGGPQGLNRYSYVYNRPLNFIDPSGYKACDNIDVNGKCVQGSVPIVITPIVGNPTPITKETPTPSGSYDNPITSGGSAGGSSEKVTSPIKSPDTSDSSQQERPSIPVNPSQGLNTGANPPIMTLIGTGLLIHGVSIVTEVGIVAAEVVLTGGTIVAPQPITLSLEIILAGVGIVVLDFDIAYAVYTYRVYEEPDVHQEINLPPPWGLK